MCGYTVPPGEVGSHALMARVAAALGEATCAAGLGGVPISHRGTYFVPLGTSGTIGIEPFTLS